MDLSIGSVQLYTKGENLLPSSVKTVSIVMFLKWHAQPVSNNVKHAE